MAYKVIILYQLYMPSYFLGTFTEYPEEVDLWNINVRNDCRCIWAKSDELGRVQAVGSGK